MAIDLFCGLGGWTEGFLSEGWDVVGFDIERHVYGDQRYPAQLVQADVLSLWGSQFAGADCIVASPPCQTYSYMAMPWGLAKREVRWQQWERDSPFGDRLASLNALFAACFRIQREACEAAGRHIPMVVENVKGAQPWVGPANAHFGSFYFWGDVAMVGNQVVAGGLRFGETVKAAKRGRKNDGGSWFNVAHNTESGTANNPVSIPTGRKVDGFNFHQFEKTGEPGGSFQSAAVALKLVDNGALKVPGINWSGYGSPGYRPQGFNVTAAQRYREEQGTKQEASGANGGKGFATGLGKGHDWRQDPTARFNSKSDSRKAASAQIARIPFPLASYIARQFRPALPA